MGPPPLAPPLTTSASSPEEPHSTRGQFASPPPVSHSSENNNNNSPNSTTPTHGHNVADTFTDDEEEPLSPEFAIGATTTISAKAAEPRKRRPSSLKRLRAAALAAGVDVTRRQEDSNNLDIEDGSREELDFGFDSDGDGYARGSMGMEDHETSSRADESDDLFLTPRRPGRNSDSNCNSRASYTPGTPNGAGNETPGEYSTFDPVMALLDDHWALLKLGGNEDGDGDIADSVLSSASPSPVMCEDDLPDYLAPLSEELLSASNLSPGAYGRGVDNSRQLMEALRDADTLEASCARYSEECAVLRKDAGTNARKALRLERENDVAAREIHRLNAAMATLQAAHDVDRRINDLLLADQTEEIRSLRKKVDNMGKNIVRSPSATSSVSGEEEVLNMNMSNKGMHTSAGRSRPKSARLRDEERANLMRRKESMFKEYEKRHSMTIQHVVRRSSLMALAAVGNSHLRRNTDSSSSEESPTRNSHHHRDQVLTPSP